jgi:tetratricopeptide (TPR) repeat protein
LACTLGEPEGCALLAARVDSSDANALTAARSLTAHARAFPRLVAKVPDLRVRLIAYAAMRLPRADGAFFELADALFRARWRSQDASWIWAEFAAELLDREQPDRASEVVAEVRSASAIAAMRADARFQPLLGASSERFDVATALERELAALVADVESAPRSLEKRVRLLEAYRDAMRFEDALRSSADVARAVAAAQAKSERAGEPEPAAEYEDAEEFLVWAANARAFALFELGRWDEAIDEFAAAVQSQDRGRPDVGVAINLASTCYAIGRAEEALRVVSDVKELSPYGRMQLERVRLAAALQLGRDDAVASALASLREHRRDAPSTFLWALVELDRLDEAAAVLADGLRSPGERLSTLFWVQEFAVPVVPPRLVAWRERWNALLARPDVRAAIAEVGRVERVPLNRPF